MPWKPNGRGAPPVGHGSAPLEIIAAGSGDGSDHSLNIPISQLRHRPIEPGELPELRSIYWRLAALGHRLPAERGVIVITGSAI